MSDLKLDPLYIIFEQHLYDFNDDTDTEQDFVQKVVRDYMKFLNTSGAVVPPRLVKQIDEELQDQVGRMLKKKMYGCVTINEFVERERSATGKTRRRRYRFFGR